MALNLQQYQQLQQSESGEVGTRSHTVVTSGGSGGGGCVVLGSNIARICSTYLCHPRFLLSIAHPIPLGWQNFLQLQGSIYYKDTHTHTTMSRKGKTPKLDLKLNLSPPRANQQVESSNKASTTSPTSPPSSCVSSEVAEETLGYSEATSMMLAGCPRCLMYVMLSEENPKCPKCKNTVLLDCFRNKTTMKTKKN